MMRCPADTVIEKMGWHICEEFQTIHNYIDTKNLILRKGSVSARDGEKLIIPINMRDGSLVCVGKAILTGIILRRMVPEGFCQGVKQKMLLGLMSSGSP